MQNREVAGAAAVIFDLDGTLIDSLPDIATTLNRLLGEQGRPPLPKAEIRLLIGDGAATLIARGFAATGGLPPGALPGLGRRFLEIYEGGAAVATRPYPGVVAALTRLAAAGLRLGVCTNKPYRPTVAILDALGLAPFFHGVLGGDSLEVKKPHPRHLAAPLAAAGGNGRALMVGDSANDVAAARALGIPVIAVSFGYTPIPAADLGADALIDHFDELPELVARWLDLDPAAAL